MELNVITTHQITTRNKWIERIRQLSGHFGTDAEDVEAEMDTELADEGLDTLLGHLRLCGAIPESYGHDSSEEKLYSKYTDVVIHEAYKAIGLRSLVLKARADVADVECYADKYSFVADAKAFRLSRTAKNQKDFKVQAMHNWKHGKPYAMVVCPIYQLPSRTSQIYKQAADRSVCIWTYSHLALVARYASEFGQENAIGLIQAIFESVDTLQPSKDAVSYWQALNRVMLGYGQGLRELWQDEKIASGESVLISREEALTYLASERERIMKMTQEEAIKAVLEAHKLENRIAAISRVKDNGLMELV